VEQLTTNRLVIIKQTHQKLIETKLISMGSIFDCISVSIPSWIGKIDLFLNELETSKEIVDRMDRFLLDLILFNHEV
jgi:hypothetical protein